MNINIENIFSKNIYNSRYLDITKTTINNILNNTKFKTIDTYTPEDDDIIIDEITMYNDKYRSLSTDLKNKLYILGKKTPIIFFDYRNDRIQTRSIQQKLGDVTTNYIIQKLENSKYKDLFMLFYIPMNEVLENYCSLKNIEFNKDICLFYKGGNVFRILLKNIINIFDKDEYRKLLKRSDADFQLYINPDLTNYNIIKEEISKLVVYVLYNLKHYMKKNNIINIPKDTDDLKNQYIEELKNNNIKVKNLEIKVFDSTRKDFIIKLNKLYKNNDKDYVMMNTYNSILDGIDSNRSVYYISINTALKFQRKDNLKAQFDLIRFRRNIKLMIEEEDGSQIDLHSPFEIIDVSIPTGEDYGLIKLKKDLYKYVQEYYFENIKFLAPTIEYQLLDLHDLLFKQNEFPWTDIKYEKRITRYFLTMIVYEIVEKLKLNKNIHESLKEIYISFFYFINFIKCLIKKDKCTFNKSIIKTIYILKLFEEYEILNDKIEKLNDEIEIKNFINFGKNLIKIFNELMKEINILIKKFKSVKIDQINDMYQKLFVHNETNIL